MKKDLYKVFHVLADKYGNTIDDTRRAEEFFGDFMELTGGVANTDFINGNNFDHIEGVEFDHEKGLMTVYFRCPTGDEEIDRMHRMGLGYDTAGMVIKLDTIRFDRAEERDQRIGILIKGYTDDGRDVPKAIMGGVEKDKRLEKEEFFGREYLKLDANGLSNFIGIRTPIIACWILPKELFIHPQDSQRMLYLYNIASLRRELNEESKEYYYKIGTCRSKEERVRLYMRAGNGMRGVCEGLLKLECNFYVRHISFKKEPRYHDLMLGDLQGVLKNGDGVLSETELEQLKEVTKTVNKLSHKSGLPATAEDVEKTFDMVNGFLNSFETKVKSVTHWWDPGSSEEEPVHLPSPGNFIRENFDSWNFKKEIDGIVKSEKGKCYFTIRRRSDSFDLLDVLQGKGCFLCPDGSFRECDVKEALKIYDREETALLESEILNRIKAMCDSEGLDSGMAPLIVQLTVDIHQCASPSHLFTREEIAALMRNADDSLGNTMVIDEDGFPHLVQTGGYLYPVSMRQFGAGNGYLGPNVSEHDINGTFHLCLEGWLYYLKTGLRHWGDSYPCINVESVVAEIQELMKGPYSY